jgi:hypothetical protein
MLGAGVERLEAAAQQAVEQEEVRVTITMDVAACNCSECWQAPR